MVHLCLLFTAMIRHSLVPNSFRFGIIQPIPKHKHGDLSNIDMYRGITLTPVLSKLFESVLLSIYGKAFQSDHLQFGFKKMVLFHIVILRKIIVVIKLYLAFLNLYVSGSVTAGSTSRHEQSDDRVLVTVTQSDSSTPVAPSF